MGYFCLISLVSLIMFSGCTAVPIRDARNAYYNNQPEQASFILEQAAQDVPERDKLIFLMAKGLILHDLGNYKESNLALLNAAKLIKEQDIISISQQTSSMVINDWVTEYKGEYSERLWVHTYLMMNFLLTYQYESAAVEAKQALKLFEKYNEALSDDNFTQSLIGLCYENLGQFNDAYIEYKKLAKSLDNPQVMLPVLYNLAKKSGLYKEAEQYKTFLPDAALEKNLHHMPPELILFVAAGKGPVKVQGNIVVPPSIRFSFPRYETRNNSELNIEIKGLSEKLPFIMFSTNINEVAKASLNVRAAKIVAKEIARVTAKEAIARAVAQKNNNMVEFLVRTVFLLLENPDTRCWETLPASLNLIRIPLLPNLKNVDVNIYADNTKYSEQITLKSNLKPGQKIYRSIRVKN